MLYKVIIDCVDGESFFICGGAARTVLDFLERHDHEGSSVMLQEFERGGSNEYPAEPTKVYDSTDAPSPYDVLQDAVKRG